jgi:histone-lysine N-methyltransferase SUV39H
MVNLVDGGGPPTNFTFITEYLFRQNTARIDAAARYGCTCRPKNGRDVGCEYTSCECIEDAGDEVVKLGFPYHAINETKGCLRNAYLNSRHVVYECNELCNCPPHCKNKVVQHGRKVPLEIFKTEARGWGTSLAGLQHRIATIS